MAGKFDDLKEKLNYAKQSSAELKQASDTIKQGVADIKQVTENTDQLPEIAAQIAQEKVKAELKKRAREAAKKAAEPIKNFIKQQIIKPIIATIPEWGPPLAIGIAIFIIFLAIYNSLAGGSGGTTLEQPSKNVPIEGPRLENAVKAQAGDKNSLSILLADEAAKASTIASNLKATTGISVSHNSTFISKVIAATGTDTNSVIRSGADFIIDSMSTVGSGNFEADKRSISESMKLIQIFQPESLDENGVQISPEIPGGELGETIKENGTNRQKELGEDLRAQISLLEEFITIADQPRLIINERDKQYISQGEIDIRILKALNYLVTPTKFGGAGHRKIKVDRIKHDYDTEQSKYSKEWGEQESDDPENRKLISPHSTGQAMDISVIGYVDRQLYKKSIAKKKKKPLSPKDILVSKQSKEKGKGIPGDGGTGLDGKNFAEIFEKAGISGLLTVVGENTGYDLSGVHTGTGTMGDIAKNVGLAIFSQETGLPIDPKQDNSSLEKIASNIGRSLIAECLNIPIDAIHGSTPEELRINIGKALVEERLGLYPRSLSGNSSTGNFSDTINSEEIIKSVGKRKIENTLGLRTMSLDYLRPGNSLAEFVGAIVIEQTLNLPAGSMVPNSLAEIKSRIGEEKFAKVFGDPEGGEGFIASGTQADKVDGLLGTSFDSTEFGSSRMTYLFKIGGSGVSPSTYKTKVGNNFLKSKIDNFGSYTAIKDQNYTPGETADHQDEVFDIPEGSIGLIKGGLYDVAWENIGLDELAKKLGNTDEERIIIRSWLENKDSQLDDIGFTEFLIDTDGNYQALDDLTIRKRERITNKNESEITRLREELEALEQEKKAYEESLKTITEGGRGLNTGQIQLLNLNIARVTESIRIKKQQLAIEIATVDQWSFISEDSLTNLFLLPPEIFSEIFINNKAAEAFRNVGQIKQDTAGVLQLTQERRVQEINRLQSQINDIESEKEIIYESEYYDDQGNIRIVDENSIQEKFKAIEKRQKNIQIRISEIANQGAAAEKNKILKDITFCNDPLIQNIFLSNTDDATNTIEKIALTMGLKKLENKTNLPSGSLDLALDALGFFDKEATTGAGTSTPGIKTTISGSATDRQLISIGQKYIEETFGPLKKENETEVKNWFDGNSLDDIRSKNITRIGLPNANLGEALSSGIESENTLLKLFGYNNYEFGSEYITKLDLLKERYNTLPLNPRDYTAAANMDKKIIDSFGVSVEKLSSINGLSAKLWAQTITPQQFSKEIGVLVAKHKIADEVSGRVDITVTGYKLSGNDIIDTLNGNILPLAIKVGAEKMDKGLVMPLGTIKAMIDNPGLGCQVKEKINGQEITESCLENILSANGKDKLAHLAGIVSSVAVSDNAKSNIGQLAIEEGLYNNSNYKKEIDQMVSTLSGGSQTALPSGWFSGENLHGIQKNILEKLGVGSSTIIETSKLDIIKQRYGTTGPLSPQDYQIANALDEKIINTISSEQARNNIPGMSARLLAGNISPDYMSDTIGLIYKNQNPGAQGTLRDLGRSVIESALDPRNSLSDFWFGGEKLDDIAMGVARAKGYPTNDVWTAVGSRLKAEDELLSVLGFGSYDFGATFEGDALDTAEQMLIALFNIEPNRGSNSDYPDPISIYGLSVASFQEHEFLKNAVEKVDRDLSLPRGTTEKLFKNTITIDEYKKVASSSHVQEKVANNVCKQLSDINIGENKKVNGVATKKTIKNILEKHNLDCSDVVDGLRDSDTLQQKAILAIIPPEDMGLILGASQLLNINIPIKGEFTANFAQKQIEEILGLNPGSFNPDQNIKSVASTNGSRRFVKAFRINLPNDRLTDSEITDFINQAVFVENGKYRDQLYWNEPIFGTSNTAKARTIDARLKISSQTGSPTKDLLVGKITIAEYIEMVRKNQFNSLDLVGVAGFYSDNGNSKVGKVFTGLGLINNLQNANFSDPNIQVALVDAFKNIGNYDIDDQIGWNPGTTKSILVNRDLAKSVLIGQGIREFSEAVLGSRLDDESITPSQEEYYNDLNLLLQYNIPGMSAPFAASINLEEDGDPRNPKINPSPSSAACSPPTVPAKPTPVKQLTGDDLLDDEKVSSYNQTQEQYNIDYAKYKQYTGPTYLKQKRSACFDMVIKKTLSNSIKNATEIKFEDANGKERKIDGITVPEKDLGRLMEGDTRILSAVGIAFSVSQINAAQIKNQTTGKTEYQLIPEGFRLSYQEIADATFGSEESRQKIDKEITDQFIQEKATEYAEYTSLFGDPESLFGPIAGFTCSGSDTEIYDCNKLQIKNQLQGQDSNPELVKELEDRKKAAQDNLIPNSKRNLQFRYLDAQLATAATINNLPPPPPNFTKTIMTGTDRERNNMLLSYGIKYLLQEATFLQDLRNEPGLRGYAAQTVTEALANIANSSDPERFQNNRLDDAGRAAVFSVVNRSLQNVLEKNLNTRITLPQNTAQLIYYSAVGNKAKFNEFGGRNIAQNFLRGQIGAVADKELGLPPGSSQATYDLGSKISSGEHIKNADIASVALIVFSKQLAKADENLGLPPGSLSSVISAVIAPNPISIAFAVYTIVFGYSKIENQMTCFQDVPLVNQNNPLKSNIDAINWRYFCKENDAMYEQWARANTRRLIDDMLRIGERTKDRSLIPPVIGTFRQEDVDFFNGIGENGVKDRQADLSTLVHGFLPFSRGVKGVHQSDYMKDFVHIQY